MTESSTHLQIGRKRGGGAQQPGAFAFALLALFLVPFLGFGLFAAGAGLDKWLKGDGEGAMMLLFGVIFCAIPLGLLALALRGHKAQQRVAALRARHPDQPWLWNESWARGRIRSSTGDGTIVAWFFAIFWNAISFPIAVTAVPREVIQRGNYGALAALIFPVIGLGLIAWAVYATLQRRKFGESVFEMSRVPGVLGGELAGTLHLGVVAMAAEEFETRLACIRRYTTGSGKNRSTHEQVHWEEKQSLSRGAAARGPSGCMLPIRFSIPYDCRASDPIPSDDRILWRLEAKASLPGVDLGESFEVPVFETSESRREHTNAAAARERMGGLEPGAGPLSRGILVRPHPAGGTEIYFPAARHKGAALVSTLLTLIFGGATFFLGQQGAPLIMQLIFGFFSVLIFCGAMGLWLTSTRVIARREEVTVRHRTLGLGRTHTLAVDQIEDIELTVGMQVGKTSYWDLWLRAREDATDGDLKAGGQIRDKREADWLVAIVSEAIGR